MKFPRNIRELLKCGIRAKLRMESYCEPMEVIWEADDWKVVSGSHARECQGFASDWLNDFGSILQNDNYRVEFSCFDSNCCFKNNKFEIWMFSINFHCVAATIRNKNLFFARVFFTNCRTFFYLNPISVQNVWYETRISINWNIQSFVLCKTLWLGNIRMYTHQYLLIAFCGRQRRYSDRLFFVFLHNPYAFSLICYPYIAGQVSAAR